MDSETLTLMDKNEIIQILEDDYGTSDPLDIPDKDRWRLYETLKSNIRVNTSNPDDYTRQIILISEALEL